MGFQLQSGVQEGDVLKDPVHIESVIKDVPVFFLEDKVDFHQVCVMGAGKMLDGFRFSHLPGSFDDERKVMGGILPLDQEGIDFPGKSVHKNHALSSLKITKIMVF